MRTRVFRIGGMSCAACSGRIGGVDAHKHHVGILFTQGMYSAEVAQRAAVGAEICRLGAAEILCE